MNEKVFPLSVCVAIGLAALAAVFSVPSMAQDVEGKLFWMLQTQAYADDNAAGSMEALNKLGLP